MHNWFVYDTFDHASKAAADYIAHLIEEAIQERDVCFVALPGGNSPKACLTYLAEKQIPWEKVHWYLGDERCYPKDHRDRNDQMLDEFFWSHISETNIHTIPAELGAEAAAKLYCKQVGLIDVFDVVFLGLGEDGHTASLFPGNNALNNPDSVVPVHNSPKPPGDRVSLGISSLKNARSRIILTGGPAKADVIKRIKSGEDLPVNRLGDINWYIDQAAS